MNTQSGDIIPTAMDGIFGSDMQATTVNSTEDLVGGGDSAVPQTPASTLTSNLSAKTALVYLAVVVVILLLLRYMRDDERTENKAELVPVNVYNVLIITGSAIIGLAVVKIAVNKYQVPGLTTLVNTI